MIKPFFVIDENSDDSVDDDLMLVGPNLVLGEPQLASQLQTLVDVNPLILKSAHHAHCTERIHSHACKIIISVIMKNFNRPWSPWLKAPRTGAARTLTPTQCIYSHTYINTVTLLTTTWCEAPAQLLQNLESIFYFNRSVI